MSSWWRFEYILNRGKVGELDVKTTQHWEGVEKKYWSSTCGLDIQPQFAHYTNNQVRIYDIRKAMVRLQHALVNAVDCEDDEVFDKVILTGELYREYYNNKDRKVKEYYRCPYHEDLLPNWEQFTKSLSKHADLEHFCISRVMLPTSPFFITNIMPILTTNIATITRLELECCDLKSTDMESICKFVKKSSVLGVLNLAKNELFGDNDEAITSAKLLAKATKKHPDLSYVNLTKTGLGKNNDALKIILEGSKQLLNSLIIDDNVVDHEGLALVTRFLKNKNAMTVFSMDGFGIGNGENGIANAKLLKQTLEKNTTLEQLCLASNHLGSTVLSNRILSNVMSGIKGSTSLTNVDLSGNEIRRMPSIKLIAKYLAKNLTLIELNLSNNGIPTKSAEVLVESLKKNTNLRHLSLRDNSISDASVPAFTDLLQNNNTLRSLDLQYNKLKVQKGRRDLMKALCDVTSLDSIVNNSNHTCSLIIAGSNRGGVTEDEFRNINALENEGEKIRYKVVLALCVLNKDLYNPRSFDDIPLELMPKLLELVTQEVGCKGFGEGIVKSVRKRNTINRLSNLYEAIHQWPAFPSLFSRGPGKLKRKRKRKLKVVDEDEDWAPKGARKQMKSSIEPNGSIVVGRGRSRRSNTAGVSYADAENSEDES